MCLHRYLAYRGCSRSIYSCIIFKEKQTKKDLDICRLLNGEKNFFYDLKVFISHYGWKG